MLWGNELMPEDNQNVQFILGQLVGKIDSLTQTVSESSTAMTTRFTAHALSDEQNFAELRLQMTKDKEDMASDRVRMAKYVGGVVVVVTLLSYVIPVIIEKVLT